MINITSIKDEKIQFDYDTFGFGHKLTATTDDNTTVSVFFDGLDVSHLEISGEEYTVSSGIDGIYVRCGRFISVHDLVTEAKSQIEGIVDEIQTDLLNEERMERELSSPYLTGRF
jgi:hypothetical protein